MIYVPKTLKHISYRKLVSGALVIFSFANSLAIGQPREASANETPPPNIIFILLDDLGYGDLSCYGSEFIDTPRIDKMASQGVRATAFRTAANICTPSRAAYLTGSYPQRAGIPNGISPLRPEHRHLGLHPNEITIPEMLKPHGYTTGMIGKWHLGFDDVFHPLNHGFDSYYGLPTNFHHDKRFFNDRELIAEVTDLSKLTSDYTEKAVEFIKSNQNRSFFLYLAHNYPHVPLEPNPDYAGKSKAGDYGDIIEELDASTGKILDTLHELDIAENSLIIFTSDNGPLTTYARDYNSSGPFRGSKFNTFEGGHRVPAIFYWPKHLPANHTCETPINAIDVLPTIAAVTGIQPPSDRVLDGKNIWQVLTGHSTTPPRDIEYYYNDNNLQGIRKNDWKIHLPRTSKDIPWWQKYGKETFMELENPFLVNLATDAGETRSLAEANPEVVSKLLQEAETARRSLGSAHSRGTGQREIGDSRILASESN